MERLPLNYQTWKHHRTLQFINFCYGAFVIGISFTIYFQTEYFYFKDVMKTKSPDFYYGLSWASLSMSGAMSSVFVSYYSDRTNNIRGICITISIANIIGNILYMLYYSPYIVIFGQFLAGTTAARNVSGAAEISRVYCQSKVSQKISIAVIFSTLGALGGPCLTFFFKYINIEIGNWTLAIGNLPGFFMCIISTVQLFLDYFLLRNVSKEFDDFLPGDKIKTGLDEHKYAALSFKEYLQSIKCLLSNKYMLAVYIINIIISYSLATLFLLQPIKFHEYLAWTQTDLAIFNIIVIIGGGLTAAIAVTMLTKYVEDFFILLGAISTNILAAVVLIFFAYYHNNKIMSYFLIYTNGLYVYISQIMFQMVVRVILIKFSPDNLRTVTDAMRNMLFESSYALAGLTIKIHRLYLVYTLSFVIFMLIFSLLWILIGHRHYRNIKTVSTRIGAYETKDLLGQQ